MEDKLKLPVGTVVQLQQDATDNQDRYTVKLLGYNPGKGLIVSHLDNRGRTVILKDGTLLIARIVQGRKAMGFHARIVETNMLPYPHLHLSYPEELEISEIRNASRVNTCEASLVRNLADGADSMVEAVIQDLSTTGARVLTRKPIATAGDSLQIKMMLEVNKAGHRIDLVAEVKKVNYIEGDAKKNKRPLFSYGVMFLDVNEIQRLVIHAYVLEQAFVN